MESITEGLNPASKDLDLRTTAEILTIINLEDETVPRAVSSQIPQLARAVDAATARIRDGGRVFYVGTGTSGRLGVLDAAELPPTFSVGPDLFQGIIAGGYGALHAASEATEDDPSGGSRDILSQKVGPRDVVVGLAASGDTPYTRGALEAAQQAGSLTVAVCCNPNSALAAIADHSIVVVVGPEVVSGSTRMKAGTAQKLIVNMFSTTIMVKLGYVYSHWMTNLQMTNRKLRARGLRILTEVSGMDESECQAALTVANLDLAVALVMLLCGSSAEQARKSLARNHGNLRKALTDSGAKES